MTDLKKQPKVKRKKTQYPITLKKTVKPRTPEPPPLRIRLSGFGVSRLLILG